MMTYRQMNIQVRTENGDLGFIGVQAQAGNLPGRDHKAERGHLGNNKTNIYLVLTMAHLILTTIYAIPTHYYPILQVVK